MQTKRQEHEPPLASGKWGWRYHHIGIPTNGTITDECDLPHLNSMLADSGQVHTELSGNRLSVTNNPIS